MHNIPIMTLRCSARTHRRYLGLLYTDKQWSYCYTLL